MNYSSSLVKHCLSKLYEFNSVKHRFFEARKIKGRWQFFGFLRLFPQGNMSLACWPFYPVTPVFGEQWNRPDVTLGFLNRVGYIFLDLHEVATITSKRNWNSLVFHTIFRVISHATNPHPCTMLNQTNIFPKGSKPVRLSTPCSSGHKNRGSVSTLLALIVDRQRIHKSNGQKEFYLISQKVSRTS